MSKKIYYYHSESEDLVSSAQQDFQLPDDYQVEKNGEKIELTHREFELLYYMAKHMDQVMTREHLLQTVWGYDYFGDVRTVDVTVHRLREKIEDNPVRPKILVTRRGVGYFIKQQTEE